MSTAYTPSDDTSVIGYMPMPPDFKYKDLFLHGRPKHRKFDDFWRKHPPMDTTHRAKIFAPFDALAGFDDAIASKKVLYEPKRALSETEKENVNQVLSHLRFLTRSGKDARKNRPGVTVTFFQPCTDIHSEWYGKGGSCRTISGICHRVDEIYNEILVDDQPVRFDDIISITENVPDSFCCRDNEKDMREKVS